MWLLHLRHIVSGHRPMTENRAPLQRNQPGGVARWAKVTSISSAVLVGRSFIRTKREFELYVSVHMLENNNLTTQACAGYT
jgi:hypothetical protein